jgi:multisubunit Na+/H+ antiporter MnhB subunit
MQPPGWPLSNLAAFAVEVLSLICAMIVYCIVQNADNTTPVTGMTGIVGLNIAVYGLLVVFVIVFSAELSRSTSPGALLPTLAVIIAYVVCQIALLGLYWHYRPDGGSMAPSILCMFVTAQKGFDLYWWVCRRRRPTVKTEPRGESQPSF